MAWLAATRMGRPGPATGGRFGTAPSAVLRSTTSRVQPAREIRQAGIAPSAVHEVLAGPGQALDAGIRTLVDRRFGHDLSRVRIHADAEAGRSTAAVDAQAYTVGRHVVFRNGFHPERAADRALLAHELAHVVQQGFADVPADPVVIGSENDPLEREADRAAGAALSAASGVHAQAPSAPSWRQQSTVPVLQRAKEKPTCDTALAGLPYRFTFETTTGGSWSQKILKPQADGVSGDIRANRKGEGLGRLYVTLALYTCEGSEEDTFEFPADGAYHYFDFGGLDNNRKYSFLVAKKAGFGTIQGNGFIT